MSYSWGRGIAAKRHRELIGGQVCTPVPQLTLCAFLWLFSPSCSTSHDRTTIQMAVGGQTQFIYLPLTIASQLGFFKDEGLTVNISDLRGGSEALDAMMGSSVVFVTGFIDIACQSRTMGHRICLTT